MIFTRIIYNAILIGMAAGLLLSLMQILGVDPIIFQAETYETTEAAIAPAGHENHDHEHAAWSPDNGLERTIYTLLANMSIGIGFAAVLLALMSQFWLPKQRMISPLHGLAWGLAGFVAIYLAPGIGLPPEIPGVEAAPVEYRQAWWLLTVISVGIGLGILALSPPRLKAIGLVFLVLPYLVGAPQQDGPAFTHPDPSAVAALVELHHRFIIISGIVNLLFWMALGLACGFAFNRWLKAVEMTNEHPA